MSQTRPLQTEAPPIADRWAELRRRIRLTCERVGRDPDGVRIVAATKTVAAERIARAAAAGLTDVGENRLQEALAKRSDLPTGLTHHFIGRLQRNKARRVVESFDWIHSIDRIELAEAVGRHARESARQVHVLIQVHLGPEASKGGIEPDGVAPLVRACAAIGGLRVRGLMAVPPRETDPERSRAHFARLRRLAHDVPEVPLDQLSMGMSGDFEIAIEEGSTMVRIGRGLFGERPPLG